MISEIIRAERRSARRYTYMLFFYLRASRAERERWRALRDYHAAQLKRWKEKQ